MKVHFIITHWLQRQCGAGNGVLVRVAFLDGSDVIFPMQCKSLICFNALEYVFIALRI